jgi:hypothetical protein
MYLSSKVDDPQRLVVSRDLIVNDGERGRK